MNEHLFSYGTLQKEKVQLESFGRILTGTKDTLKGYKLSFLEIKDESVLLKSEQKFHPIAIHSENNDDCVEGIVFEVTVEELLLSDSYEVGDYVRVKEVLTSGKQAWVYVAKKDGYPHYLTYKNTEKKPSALKQEFPLPSLEINEVYYPENVLLTSSFSSEIESQNFGAAQFCSFLRDTIEVEHCLVIPAIVCLRRIPFQIPSQPKQDLYKTATDEGFHAEQANTYLTELEKHFGLPYLPGKQPPLFLRRLENLRSVETDPLYRDLITIINGIVTETRISVELSKFAANKELSGSVRIICDSHARDEVIHSSQFQALGYWLWEEFDEQMKTDASEFYIKSTIARSLPDIERIVHSFMKVTGLALSEVYRIVLSKYNADELIKEMLIAAKPTISYLKKLGIERYQSFDRAIEKERIRLEHELNEMQAKK